MWVNFEIFSYKDKSEFEKDVVDENGNGMEAWTKLRNYYYDKKDLRLLLNLLAETSGPTTSLRVLALFDEKIHSLFEVRQMAIKIKKSDEPKQSNQTQESEDCLNDYEVSITFKEPLAINGMFKRMKWYLNTRSIYYQAEIFPTIPILQKSKRLWIASITTKGKSLSTEEEWKTTIEENGRVFPKKISLRDLDIVTNSFEELKERNEEKDERKKTRMIRINTMVDGKTLSYQDVWIGPIKRKAKTDVDGQKQTGLRNDNDGKTMSKNLLTELKNRL